MQEQLLFDFLKGKVDAPSLGPALLSAQVTPEDWSFRTTANYRVDPMLGEHEIRSEDLVRLVTALEEHALTAEQVAIACFLLESGIERFKWDTDTADGERVANAIFWLGSPELNYPLTSSVLVKIKHYLHTGEDLLGGTDPEPGSA